MQKAANQWWRSEADHRCQVVQQHKTTLQQRSQCRHDHRHATQLSLSWQMYSRAGWSMSTCWLTVGEHTDTGYCLLVTETSQSESHCCTPRSLDVLLTELNTQSLHCSLCIVTSCRTGWPSFSQCGTGPHDHHSVNTGHHSNGWCCDIIVKGQLSV